MCLTFISKDYIFSRLNFEFFSHDDEMDAKSKCDDAAIKR